jgi:hypothetical protein
MGSGYPLTFPQEEPVGRWPSDLHSRLSGRAEERVRSLTLGGRSKAPRIISAAVSAGGAPRRPKIPPAKVMDWYWPQPVPMDLCGVYYPDRTGNGSIGHLAGEKLKVILDIVHVPPRRRRTDCRGYFARFHTTSAVPPAEAVGT